eukprot:scaffold128971_cov31-Tisochrysis_lutea.AAC.1
MASSSEGGNKTLLAGVVHTEREIPHASKLRCSVTTKTCKITQASERGKTGVAVVLTARKCCNSDHNACRKSHPCLS